MPIAIPRWARRALALLAAGLVALQVPRAPRLLLERGAAELLAADPAAERSAALGAVAWGPVGDGDFATGGELYDREWVFGTPMMRAACLAQVSLRDRVRRGPSGGGDLAAELAGPLDDAVRDMAAPAARAFSESRWGSDPLEGSAADHDHAAWLGYAGFALGLASRARPDGPAPELFRAVVARLRARHAAARGRWLRTYPGEVYPVDVAAGLGALAIAARLEGRAAVADGAVRAGLERMRGVVDGATGLLPQSLDATAGEALDGPRGSGTFLAAWFLTPADPDLARSLYRAGRRELGDELLGFFAMRERPPGSRAGGDVDSGPLVFGFGVSATGFALGPARAFGDAATFRAIHATAELFGAPHEGATGVVRHASGGPLGDAILCAMRTAPTPAELDAWLGVGGAS